MKSVLLSVCLLGLGCCVTGEGADINLTGGNVNLLITSASPGTNPDGAMDSNCRLNWTTAVSDPIQKITVESSLLHPQFPLHVQALGVNGGTAEGLVAVGSSADFVTNILAGTNDGQATLKYQANATAAEGAGSDSHNITFTITVQ
jgi:hypothetical protein